MGDVNICRVCLKKSRKLRCLYQTILSKNVTIADIIACFVNIKLYEGDGYPDKVCILCQNKLLEMYDFKLLIERSDLILRNSEGNGEKYKKIVFNNISEVEIEPFKCEVDVDLKPDLSNNLPIEFDNNSDSAIYKNITIKKVNIKNEESKRPAVSVEEFLNSIEDESHYCDDLEPDDNHDDDYLPHPLYESLKNKKTKNHQKKTINDRKKQRQDGYSLCKKIKPVRPVILEDFRLVVTPSQKPKLPKIRRRRKHVELICPYCGKITKNIKSHMLIHTGEKKYKCAQCSKAFFRKITLDLHEKIHSGVKDFKCSICIAAFHTKGLLKSHERSHAGSTNICSICNKGFKRKNTLDRHILRHSSANKNIKCELCNMSFYEPDQLKHHMRIHTGERPYKCEICSQPYSYKHDFNRHCLKKHGVFLKQRSVYVMNEEVLVKERALMRELLLNANAGSSFNPFKGPRASLAYQQAIKALTNRQVNVLDF